MTTVESLSRMICDFYEDDPDNVSVKYTGEYFIDDNGYAIPEVVGVPNWMYYADLSKYLTERLSL